MIDSLKELFLQKTVGGKDLPHLDSLLGIFLKIQASGRERGEKMKEMIKNKETRKIESI